MNKHVLSILTTGLCVALLSFGGMAQDRNDLKGPKAKNFKPWQSEGEGATLHTSVKSERLTGPEAKNSKPWQTEVREFNTVATPRLNRNELKGPRAKNLKPWQKSE